MTVFRIGLGLLAMVLANRAIDNKDKPLCMYWTGVFLYWMASALIGVWSR